MTPRQRRILILMIVATLMEGACRKWLLPQVLAPVAYFAKDVLGIVFLVCRKLRKTEVRLASLKQLAYALPVLLAPAMILGLFRTPLGVVLTLKNAILWPLVALSLAGALDEQLIDQAIPYLAGFSVISAGLSWLQALSPATSLLNSYAWDAYSATDKSLFGSANLVRATGTFSYMSGLATFAATSFLLFGWRLLSTRSRLVSWTCLIGMSSAIVSALASGSRTPIGFAAVGLLMGLLFAGRLKTVLQIIIVVGVVGLAGTFLQEWPIFAAYLDRVQTAGDKVDERVLGEGLTFVTATIDAPIGHGLGTSSQAVNFEALGMTTAEDARVRLVWEAGFLGLVTVLITAGIVVAMLDRARRARLSARIGAGIIGIPALYAVAEGLWFDHTGTALWWILIGSWASYLLGASTRAIRTRSNLIRVRPALTGI